MKVLFVLCLAVALSHASDVLVLTADNFVETVTANSPILVEFYAPWCGHCKTLEPEYEEAATALLPSGIRIAKVDATAHESLAQQFQIQGFPTLKLFKNGGFVQDYSGARDAAGIQAYMIAKSGDPYKTVASLEEANELLAQQDGGIVVGYFSDFESDDFLDFVHVADQDLHVPFVLISESEAANGCFPGSELGDGFVAVFGKDGSKHRFEGDIEEGLPAFCMEHAFPQSMDLNPQLFAQFIAGGIVVVTAYDFESAEAATFRTMATEVVKAHPALKQSFADSNQWGQALVRMGVISGNTYPMLVAFQSEGEHPISWDEEKAITAESMAEWLDGVVAGNAETWKMSEPIPTSQEGDVVQVVGKNFEAIVYSDKNVLLEFYAPWCGHCKNLVPIYEDLAAHFKSNDNVVIAKIDATANYIDPSMGVKGFPTIKLITSGGEILDYDGDRTLDDLVAFMGDYGTA